MDNTYKIAIASSDGIVVNQHFGHADRFYIYNISGHDITKSFEIRFVEPVCNGGNHNEQKLTYNLKKLQDCKYLIVSKIGVIATQKAESMGIIPMELPDIIEQSIRKAITFEQIQNLFERN